MGALGFVPLFDGPGYESALGAGIILAFVVAISAALNLSPGSREGAPAPIDALSRGLATGALFAFAAWLTTLAHGLRAGFCGALSGSEPSRWGPAQARSSRGRGARSPARSLAGGAAGGSWPRSWPSSRARSPPSS